MSKFKIYFSTLLVVVFLSCSDNKEISATESPYINLTASNPKAIDFYRKANLHLSENEYSEAKESFLSALRLDPNMPMALLNINESNTNLSNNYRQRAISKFNSANKFEKLYIEWDTLNGSDFIKRQEIAKRVIELYPDKVDGYFMLASSLQRGYRSPERIKILEKILEIDPNNARAQDLHIRGNFRGQDRVISLKNNVDFYNSFDAKAQVILKKFPNSLSVLSMIASRYKVAYNFSDEKRFQKANDIYQKCLKIVDERGSTFKVNLLREIAHLNLVMGKNDEAFEYLNSAIKIAGDSDQIIGSHVNLFLFYIYLGDYLSCVGELNKFENQFENYGFTEEEILKCLVGVNYIKSIIYAHANQREKSQQSFEEYKKNSEKLIQFYGLESDVSKKIAQISGNNSIMWKEASPISQIRNEIWINTIVGNFEKSNELQSKMKDLFGYRIDFLDGIKNVLEGNSIDGYKILQSNRTAYVRYFKAQALIGMGEIEKAKSVLDTVRQLPGLIFQEDLVIKRSSELYKSL